MDRAASRAVGEDAKLLRDWAERLRLTKDQVTRYPAAGRSNRKGTRRANDANQIRPVLAGGRHALGIIVFRPEGGA